MGGLCICSLEFETFLHTKTSELFIFLLLGSCLIPFSCPACPSFISVLCYPFRLPSFVPVSFCSLCFCGFPVLAMSFVLVFISFLRSSICVSSKILLCLSSYIVFNCAPRGVYSVLMFSCLYIICIYIHLLHLVFVVSSLSVFSQWLFLLLFSLPFCIKINQWLFYLWILHQFHLPRIFAFRG